MNTAEFAPGALIEVPAGSYYRRAYCLRITVIMSVSKETGAVELVGRVLSLAGTTTRKHPLVRRIVVSPDRVTLREAAPQDQAVRS